MKIKSNFKNNGYVFLFMEIVLFQLVYIYSLIQMDFDGTIQAFIVVFLASSSFYLLFTSVFRNKYLRAAAITLAVLFLYANVINYRYFEGILRIGSVYAVENVPFVFKYIIDLTALKDSIFIFCLIPIYFIIISGRYAIMVKPGNIVVIFLIFTFFFSVRVLGYTYRPYQLKKSDTYSFFQNISLTLNDTIFNKCDRSSASVHFGFIPGFLFDIYQFWGSERYRAKIDARKIYDEQAPFIESKRNLPNIFLIQIESLDFEIIGKTHNGKVITPFLNSLTRKSVYFDNFFAQHTAGGGTSDVDFSVLTSLYPLGTKPPFFAYGLNRVASLPYILRKAGYETAAFHGNIGSFWRRSYAFNDLGFEYFYSSHSYDNTLVYSKIVPDRYFFEQSLRYLNGFKKPFLAYFITLSSHGPYSELLYIDKDDMESAGTFSSDGKTDNYFRVMHYVDRYVQDFVTEVTSTFPESVIFIFGDHTSNLSTKEYKANRIKNFEKVPLFVLFPGRKEGKTVSTLGTHLDIPATVLSLLDITRPADWQGIDLFKEDRDFLLMKDTPYYLGKNGVLKKIDSTIDTSKLYLAEKYLQ